jgi:outer membrane receptor protein involved in Fe transport
MVLRTVFPACLLMLALARAEPLASMEEVVVRAPAPLPPASASEPVITAEEIASRPISRPGEIMEAAPGLIASQHSGEGKANQYFLRGFNLDHGTDLAITLDGMPLNMRSHAHGQGYADLNFLIPELLAEMRLRKGPYGADQGDFANAGQVLGDGGPGWFADARLRIFGARPLVEDNSVCSSPTAGVNLRGGYRFDNGVTARLDALNLFGARASQIDYFYLSRLRGEVAGVEGRHFHPVEPVAIRLTLSVAL